MFPDCQGRQAHAVCTCFCDDNTDREDNRSHTIGVTLTCVRVVLSAERPEEEKFICKCFLSFHCNFLDSEFHSSSLFLPSSVGPAGNMAESSQPLPLKCGRNSNSLGESSGKGKSQGKRPRWSDASRPLSLRTLEPLTCSSTTQHLGWEPLSHCGDNSIQVSLFPLH